MNVRETKKKIKELEAEISRLTTYGLGNDAQKLVIEKQGLELALLRRDPPKNLKLFLWEGVLTDYTSGMMGALAPDVETARKLLLEQCSFIPKSDLEQEPQVITEMSAFHCWGGG